MAKPVFQFVALAYQKIAEKLFKEFGGLLNSRLKVRIIRTDKGIPKIPGIFGENVVIDSKAERAKIFDGKYRRRPCVSLPERMNLPNPRDKKGDVPYGFFHAQVFVAEFPFLPKVVVQSRPQLKCRAVYDGIAVQDPFGL